MTEDTVIQRVGTNHLTYGIVPFNQRTVSNLANFCCMDDRNIKSTVSWDFTFDLGKSPLYYVLALNYQNITLIDKTTGKSLVMLGPVLVCYKKDRKVVKLLCDTLLDVALTLAEKLKVFGADEENTLLNQTCGAFLLATLLLCIGNMKKNVQINLTKNRADTKRNEVVTAIFGNMLKKRLVDSS